MPDLRSLPPNATIKADQSSRTTSPSSNDTATPADELSVLARQVESPQSTSSSDTLRARRSPLLSQAAILQLQRTVGNRETRRVLRRLAETDSDTIHRDTAEIQLQGNESSRLPEWGRHERPTPTANHDHLVQRYVQIKGGKYTTYVGSKEKMFALQAAKPTYDRKGANTLATNNQLSAEVTDVVKQIDFPQYKTVTPNSPALRLSDDGTLAVPAQEGMQSKVLYAAQAVIDDANNRLAAAGSSIRLAKVGNSIGVTHNQDFHLLHQVKPYAQAVGPTMRGALADFGTSICIDMATKIVSGIAPTNDSTRRMIFEPSGGGAQERVGYGKTDGQNLANVHKLAEAVTDPNFDPANNIGTQVTGTAANAATGQTYGTALGQGNLDQTAQTLGINQYAKPEVGEAFSIHSIQTAIDNTVHTDFATGNINMDTWGYHFAGVVAKSLDGNDYVTLENYNRAQEVLTDALRTLVQKRAKRLGPVLAQQLATALDGSATMAIMEILEHAFGFTTQIGESAVELQQHINQSVAIGELWYFAMYGSNPGQTFHELQAESGAYNNPMTVRTGHQNAPGVPAIPGQGKLTFLTVTANDIMAAGGAGEGGWGTMKTSSLWKQIYEGTQTLENKGYTQSRIRDLHNYIIGWQSKHEDRNQAGDAQKRALLDQLRPEVENILTQYKNNDYP